MDPHETEPQWPADAWPIDLETITDDAPLSDDTTPMLPRTTPVRRSSRIGRVALITAATSALVVSAAVSFAASPTAAPSTGANAPAASGDPGTNPPPGFPGAMPGGFPGGPGGDGGAWTGPGGKVGTFVGELGDRLGFGKITITAVSGSSISLKTDDGWTRTVDTTGATITKAGATVTAADLSVGDTIRLQEDRATDGTFTISGIEVVLPRVDGTVSDVSGDTLTVTLPDGSSQKVGLTSATTYFLGDTAATKSAVTAGVRIDAEGTGSGDAFVASTVRVQPAIVFGQVASKTASSITVSQRDGMTDVINVDASTTYTVDGVTSPTLADIKVGDNVFAQGTARADGSLDATSVSTGKLDIRGGSFGGGRGPGGPGFGGGFGGRGGPGGPGSNGQGSNQDPNATPAPTQDPGT